MSEQSSPPTNVGSHAGLGPLPEARWLWAGNGPRPYEDAYTADQMRGYAANAVIAERAWFVQVLSEWDRTEDVEAVLRLRLERA